jgi:tRNA A-37 threonylcarbamoyl transferase component Bud32
MACAGSSRDWLHALEGFSPHHATSLKVGVGSEVCRATMLGRTVVVKIRLARGPIEWLKRRFRMSRGWRQWRGVPRLVRAGVGSPAPLVLAVERTEAGMREWLVLDAARGRSLLEHLADFHAGRGVVGVSAQHAMARAMARLLLDLDRAGLYNRDHKPSNIIVTSLGQGGSMPTFALIDTVAIRRGRGVDRMLHALYVEPLGLKIPPRRALAMRVIHELVGLRWPGVTPTERRARRHGLWIEVARAIERHGDPTPRDNPLG